MRSLTLRVGLAVALACVAAAPLRAADKPDAKPDPTVARRISPEEVQKKMAAGAKPIILDTRGHVNDVVAKGAIAVTNSEIEPWAKNVPHDALIVAYCT